MKRIESESNSCKYINIYHSDLQNSLNIDRYIYVLTD